MSRKKIGLLVVAAIVVAAAAVAGGNDQDAAAVIWPVPSPTVTPAAVESPASSVAPTQPSITDPTPTLAPLAGRVVDVVDGDTIRVELPSGVETVRIIGIDTPEVVAPDRPEACFGREATAFATDLLDGEDVTLETDPTQDERDRYDRLLAHVYLGDELYAAQAIAGGYGIHYIYEVPSSHAAELDAAADTAREGGLGIWASCDGRVDLPVVAEPTEQPAPVEEPVEEPVGTDCHPSYEPCVPNAGHDLDCGDIGFAVTVIGPDEYRLDRDHDGGGCESY
jgi:micrococcal nuclease